MLAKTGTVSSAIATFTATAAHRIICILYQIDEGLFAETFVQRNQRQAKHHDQQRNERTKIDAHPEPFESGELQLSTDGLHLLEHVPVKLTVPGLSVLLVEDDDDHALLVTEVLERALEGAVVSRAGSVAGAAELSHGSTWSLAVVDHNLPDGLGMQVLDALRAHDPTMPIVMLTGQGSEEMAIEAFRHGASDYVVKGGGYLDALASRVRSLVTVA